MPEGAVRIDRKTKWGNPFPMRSQTVEERDRVIEAYRKALWADIRAGRVWLADLAALDGKPLACWCAPLPCHGDALLAAAAWASTLPEDCSVVALGTMDVPAWAVPKERDEVG
jgi:hypothetical protein